MWAQLITVQVKEGNDIAAVSEALKAGERPGSGLIRELFLRDQNDPHRFSILALFASQEMARAREADPRRAETTATIQSLLREILAAPPQFTDFEVLEDWIVEDP